MEDKEHWSLVKKSMSLLDISQQIQDEAFSILSGILHLGNVNFKTGDGKMAKVIIENEQEVNITANFLRCDATLLKAALLIRTNIIKSEKFKVPYEVAGAADARDALAKALYDRLFTWLVTKINVAIAGSGAQQKDNNFIGVLDIFGFENFLVNSFEQFCINYTNEKLQQHFNHHIFKLEQAEYERQGINWSSIKFKDNQECIDMIEGRPLGILALLDEESHFPKGSDGSLLLKLHKQYGNHDYYETPKKKGENFIIKHYAGAVSYETRGFLEKNRDTLGTDLLLAVKSKP